MESYRKIYDASFFDDLIKNFNVKPKAREDFEIIILAAAEAYESSVERNKNIEPVYKAKSKTVSLQKKLVSARQEYEDFLDSPEATADEVFIGLDELYDQGKHKRFFDFLHDQRYEGGGSAYNLRTIKEFFDALIEATKNAEKFYDEGRPLKKNDSSCP